MTPLIVRELETAWNQHLTTTAHAPDLAVDADPPRPPAPTARTTCDPPF
ncbi:hypothetical protein [Brachybacterium sp. NPDC056505]